MKQIEASLLEQINNNLRQKYSIIITTQNNALDNLSKDGKIIKLMDNIYSATVSGSKVKSIAKNTNVLSIEKDIMNTVL